MIRVINKTTCRLGCGAAAVVEVCVVDLGRVCVWRGGVQMEPAE